MVAVAAAASRHDIRASTGGRDYEEDEATDDFDDRSFQTRSSQPQRRNDGRMGRGGAGGGGGGGGFYGDEEEDGQQSYYSGETDDRCVARARVIAASSSLTSTQQPMCAVRFPQNTF
jgi:hypothetical protein